MFRKIGLMPINFAMSILVAENPYRFGHWIGGKKSIVGKNSVWGWVDQKQHMHYKVTFDTVVSDDGKKFFAVKNRLVNWFGANKLCHEIFGSRLASITNRLQNDALADYMRGYGDVRFWIGANKLVDDTKFVWYLIDQKQMNYQYWMPGEPNNNGNEMCVEFVYDIRKIVQVEAVEGHSVSLPCSVTPPNHDKVYMVFWFQDDAGIPLYSFDVRGKPLSAARHWSAPEVFGSRAHFRADGEPARLELQDARRHDAGVYRCRVDYRHTQTRSLRYNLTVIVPPEIPAVLDRWGRQLNGTQLGPHEEGDDVMLTCRVVGGRPPPTVSWLVNGLLVDGQAEQTSGDVIENRLMWPTLARADLGALVTCQAINTQLIEPRETSFVLDMHLRPLTATIIQPSESLVADRRYEVICESVGSRPPAIITWYKGKRQLRRTKDESHENRTVSSLSFVPSTEDDGKEITCRAENPNVTGMFKETVWTLDVVYPPIVTLRLGSTLSADDIKEGDDVYFECHVSSNPPWRRLLWMHDGAVLSHNTSGRVFRSNQSLVLQHVTRQSAGKYACSAINSEGETISNELDFRVKYAPVCQTDQVSIVGAGRGEEVLVLCSVQADPGAKAFRWQFNNSGETLPVDSGRFSTNGTTSTLRYTPVSDQDYGSLSCWAINEVGVQIVPCMFQIVFAGIPTSPKNCSLFNQTADSAEIECESGYDGGLPQHFLLEIFSGQSRKPRYNQTNLDTPDFYLYALEQDIKLKIMIFAINAKGRSPPFIIDEVMFTDSDQYMASAFAISLSPLLGAGLGVVLTLSLALLVLLYKLKRDSTRDKLWIPAGKDAPVLTNEDDPDPDVIPAKHELNGLQEDSDSEFAKPVLRSGPGRPHHWKSNRNSRTEYGDSTGGAWDTRPKDLLLPKKLTSGGSDIDLNTQTITDRLMASRVPESCV
ncbi:hemicentin-1-like [Ctenocephalides felis]|uniref:hemicentin-1-like n=1 Tax=Ctenocephalides felis TaxID=7515 RepID=UPI000E6E3DAD|nr:hemicentin-1-like [Ctenocephalides felis]